MRAPGIKRRRGRRAAPATLSARIGSHVTLEAHSNGKIVACFDHHSVDLGQFSAGAADRAQDLRMGLPLGSFESGGRDAKEIQFVSPAIGQSRPIGVPARALAKRRGRGRHRAAGCRLLAANATAQQCRHPRPIAVRIHATARQRDGPGIAARRRIVQNLQSEDCERHSHTIYTATIETAPSPGRFPWCRSTCSTVGLPNPFQDRPCSRQQSPTGRGQ